ncbi:UxaA family hydrolase, partial [Bacillus haynesii]|nr:UxaA family hydrolase [Bacillus haynesii]
ISGVLGPGEKAEQKGLLFAATPASDFVCGTLQLAAGMNLQVFTTGRGTPYGLAAAPVLKVSTRHSLSEHRADLSVINAGRIATGEPFFEVDGWVFLWSILVLASGRD